MGDSLLKIIAEGVREHWLEILASLLLMGIGWFAGRWRARREWSRLEFLSRINVSLNMIRDGKLLIRTVVEKPLGDVFINPAAVERVQGAAQKTTEEHPLLVLADKDRWPILNCVLNEVSERFSQGHLRQDLGEPVASDLYLLCLTRERSSDIRTNKIRAMLIKKALFEALPAEEPEYEFPSHSIRFKTLKRLRELYDAEPDSFVEVELVC